RATGAGTSRSRIRKTTAFRCWPAREHRGGGGVRGGEPAPRAPAWLGPSRLGLAGGGGAPQKISSDRAGKRVAGRQSPSRGRRRGGSWGCRFGLRSAQRVHASRGAEGARDGPHHGERGRHGRPGDGGADLGGQEGPAD